MASIEHPSNKDSDPYADWDIFIPLVENDDDEAHYLIHNEPGGEDHRIHITGYDRHASNAVFGRLYHVVHGIVGGGSTKPATLIVFEWLLIPNKLGHRFRKVDIDVTFAVKGGRPGQLPEADLSRYTPQVKTVAPNVPIRSFFSGRDVTEQTGQKLGLNAGYAPFVTVNPEVSHSTTDVTSRTDFRFAAGHPAMEARTWGDPDSVHWTLHENAPQRSGTQSQVRTAVLLHRLPGDANGAFTAVVKTKVEVSRLEDAMEKLKDLVGLVPRDDPLNFNPRPIDGIEHGAAVLYASRDVEGVKCPIDKNNLGAEKLENFLIEDDDAKWRVRKASSAAEQGTDAEKETTQLTAEVELGSGDS